MSDERKERRLGRPPVVWTEEMDRALLEGRKNGESWAAVSDRIGVCEWTARNQAARLGIPTKKVRRLRWTPEVIEQITEMHADGKSARQIAKVMPEFTRSAIQAKLTRMKNAA